MKYLKLLGFAGVMILAMGIAAQGAERDPLKPRVPAAQMEETKKLKPAYGDTRTAPPELVAAGKKLFEGKGTCVNCHGQSGQGDGPAGMMLSPSPRNFTNCEFHKMRSDGELFWVIKNGSAGTDMVPLIGTTINEEEAWTILAYERSFCKHKE